MDAPDRHERRGRLFFLETTMELHVLIEEQINRWNVEAEPLFARARRSRLRFSRRALANSANYSPIGERI